MNVLHLSSALLGFLTTGIAGVAGWCTGVVWLGSPQWTKRALILLAAASWLIPPFLLANTWLAWAPEFLMPRSGDTVRGVLLVSLLLAGMLWPLVFGLLLVTWRSMDRVFLDMEPRLTGWTVWRYVLLPMAAPVLPIAALVVFALAITDFSLPTLFQVRVFTEEFWLRFNTQFDAAGAFRSVWPLGLLLLVPLVVSKLRARWDVQRIGWSAPVGPSSPGESGQVNELARLWRQRLGASFWWAMLGAAAVSSLSLFLPMGRLLVDGQTWAQLPTAWASGRQALLNSAQAALLSATVAMVLGMLLAGLGGRPRRVPVWIWGLFLMPGILAGVGWIWLLNRPWTHAFYQGFGILILALVTHYLALAWGVSSAVLSAENSALRDPARLETSEPWALFRWIEWPLGRPGFLVGWYGVYLLCLWDVESIVLLVPPGGETLSLRIFNLLHYGHAGHVHSLTLALMLLGLLPALLYFGSGGAFLLGRRLGNSGKKATGTGSEDSVTAVRHSRQRVRTRRKWGKWGTWLTVGGLAGLAAGCGPNPDSATTATVASRIFSEARVLGSRGVAPGQFNKPRSVTCDDEGNLYVADLTGRIQKFAPDGRHLLQWHVEQTDLGKPKGMGMDPAGNILVIEPHYMRVNHFDREGNLLGSWGTRGRNPGEFILPRGIAVNSRGEYYLSEYTVVDRVQRFGPYVPQSTPDHEAVNVKGPCFLGTWGVPGEGEGEFGRAENLCVGLNDTVHVADSCNHRIQIFDVNGRFLRLYGEAGHLPGQLSYPYDIRVDADGYQYVCEFGNSRISVFDPQNQWVESIGNVGGRPGEFSNPWSIALDPDGNLYVADSQNHRVQKLMRRPEWNPSKARRDQK